GDERERCALRDGGTDEVEQVGRHVGEATTDRDDREVVERRRGSDGLANRATRALHCGERDRVAGRIARPEVLARRAPPALASRPRDTLRPGGDGLDAPGATPRTTA